MDKENKDDSIQRSESNGRQKPIVVGIGASAGGLSVLKRFFEHVPVDSGLAFVVIVHLSPEHKSHLADLLQPSVKFPVMQVTETTRLDPNNLYVIPPNANLSAIDTHLRLTKLESERKERAPIDHFFRTLASTFDGHSVGVILTGTGSDGTLGLKEIKAKGGFIIVQDPNEAEFDGMPQSAIATGLVDKVLPVSDMPEALLRYVRTEPRVPTTGEGDVTEHADRVLLPKILAILRTRTDRDFSRYKPATILRRIGRRMQLNYIEDFDRYIERLREQPDESRALADDLLITVTSFFRDQEVFQELEKEVIPGLFEGKGPQDSLRVWTVGCATGEEAYSIAMLLIEEASRRDSPPHIQVFASDLHKRSLDAAREGVYPGDIESDVSPERLKRFFQKENGGYRIRKEVRDIVVFAPHNLLSDPPFSRVHLVSCRNLLIYLDRSVQRDVIDLFHYSLCPDGYLLLGSAETVDASDLFRAMHKKLCLYRKRNVRAPEPRLPVFPLTRIRTPGEPHYAPLENAALPTPYGSVHQILLERYAPPSMLVSPDNKIVHLSEHAGRYLLHPGGELTSSALKLVRNELRIELQANLEFAREKKEPRDSRPILVQFNGHPTAVVMHIRPARDPEQDGYTLVIFNELETHNTPTGVPDRATDIDGGEQSKRIGELEAELTVLRQRMQAVIEEYETSREEMKASNEEMQSSNEELRSTMEELETSKEELQSINEELQTVNQENRHKVEELSQLSSDLQNLLSATDIATLFLDRDLRILRFTPKVSELFSVRITDRGRPISDLTHRLGYAELRSDAEAVLRGLVPIEREIQDESGRWYLTRVLPYRNSEDRIEGTVITFIDITTQKAGEREFNAIANFVPDLLWRTEPNGRTGWYNQRWYDYAGLSAPKNEDLDWTDLIHPDDAAEWSSSYFEAFHAGQPLRMHLRIRGRDQSYRWFLVQAEPFYDETGRLVWWFGAATDVHKERMATESLRDSLAEKEELLKEVHHRVKNNLQIISSLLNMQANQSQDDQLKTSLQEARNRVQSIASVNEVIYRSDSFAAMEISTYARRLVPEVVRLYGAESRIKLEISADGVVLDLQRAIPLGLILNELVSNVCKHALPSGTQGTLGVHLRKGEKELLLSVSDTGSGLPHSFDYEGADSLGVFLVKSLARQLRATVKFASNSDGTTVEVRIPLEFPLGEIELKTH